MQLHLTFALCMPVMFLLLTVFFIAAQYQAVLAYEYTPLLNAAWYYGQTYNILYDASPSVLNVQIYLYKQYSIPGYITLVSLIANTPNTGSYAWTVPSVCILAPHVTSFPIAVLQ